MQRLSGLSLAVMRVLWRLKRATVADVQAALAKERPLAYSTLATILKRLEDKGAVRHVAQGRTFVYEPVLAQNEVGGSLLSDLVVQVFAGRPSELVCHLLESQDVDASELARIKALIAEHETAAARRPRRKPS